MGVFRPIFFRFIFCVLMLQLPGRAQSQWCCLASGYSDLHYQMLYCDTLSETGIYSISSFVQKDDSTCVCKLFYHQNDCDTLYCRNQYWFDTAFHGLWTWEDTKTVFPLYFNHHIYSVSVRNGTHYLLEMSDQFDVIHFGPLTYQNKAASLISWRRIANGMLWKLKISGTSSDTFVSFFKKENGNQIANESIVSNLQQLVEWNHHRFVVQSQSSGVRICFDSLTGRSLFIDSKFGKYADFLPDSNKLVFLFSNRDTLKIVSYRYEDSTVHFDALAIKGGENTGFEIIAAKQLNRSRHVVSGRFYKGSYQLFGGSNSAFAVVLDSVCSPYQVGYDRYVKNNETMSASFLENIWQLKGQDFRLLKYEYTGNNLVTHGGWRYSERITTDLVSYAQITQSGWQFPLKKSEIKTQQFYIFPNPASTSIGWSVPQVKLVEIADVWGRMVMTQVVNESGINIGHLSDGLYQIILTDKYNVKYVSRFRKLN